MPGPLKEMLLNICFILIQSIVSTLWKRKELSPLLTVLLPYFISNKLSTDLKLPHTIQRN